jgi:flagellar hook-associated protein 3 FlgL
MRVTEGRMVDLAQVAVSRARTRAAEAGEVATTGVAVAKASENPGAWAQGARAAMRNEVSEGRGRGVAAARERLAETESSLETIGDVLGDVRELAVQMANGGLNASDRAGGAIAVRAMREQILAAANKRGGDGEFVLAGAQGDAAPFSAAGVYSGDGTVRQVHSSETGQLAGSINGTVLGASEGVDIFASLDTLATALENNDVPGIQASLETFRTAINQVSRARTSLGAQVKALEGADVARTAFEQHLAEEQNRVQGADPAEAYSNLQHAASALEAARAVAEKLVAMSQR